MDLIKTLLVIGVLGIGSNSYGAESELIAANKDYLECSIKFDSTGNIDNFEACSKKVLDKFTNIILYARSKDNYANKSSWQKTNKALNAHLSNCKNTARKSQKNSTIRRDLLSCKVVHARSLAHEASKFINK